MWRKYLKRLFSTLVSAKQIKTKSPRKTKKRKTKAKNQKPRKTKK